MLYRFGDAAVDIRNVIGVTKTKEDPHVLLRVENQIARMQVSVKAADEILNAIIKFEDKDKQKDDE